MLSSNYFSIQSYSSRILDSKFVIFYYSKSGFFIYNRYQNIPQYEYTNFPRECRNISCKNNLNRQIYIASAYFFIFLFTKGTCFPILGIIQS